MPLTAAVIDRAKPAMKPYKLADQHGLALLVTPSGSKWWRFRYRFEGREKMLSLGVYPMVSLKEARARRDDARKIVAVGGDPSRVRQATREARATTFEGVAREWHATRYTARAPRTNAKVLSHLERHLFPWLGARPIAAVEAPELLATLRRVESTGAIETAHRVMQADSMVFRYAVATGRATRNPAADLKGALAPVETTHRAAIVEPRAFGALLRAIDGYDGLVVRLALKLLALTFVRPGDLRGARWEEFDLAAGRWTVPAARTKTRRDHVVPLCRQALATLEELRPLARGGELLFPGTRTRSRPISDNTLNAALRRMGYAKSQMSAHGFRAAARTLLDEQLRQRVEWIEAQLDHDVRDLHGRAYNRTQFSDERRVMMARWGDYLDALRAGNVVTLTRRAVR
jgi:integrase